MLALIVGLVFCSVFAACMLLYQHLNKPRQEISQRLDLVAAQSEEAVYDSNSPTSGTSRAAWRSLIRHLGRHFESKQWSRLIEHKLIQAGLPLKGSEFLVICLGSGFFAGTLCLLLIGKVIVAILGFAVGFAVPLIVLRAIIGRRVKAFNNQLGDCLVLIANSLRTGYSFMQAIQMVASEMLPPISVEFARTLREMNLGVTTEEALNNLAKRINSDDLDLVLTAVMIQRQIGGNLAEILDNIAGTIRERQKIKGEIRTLTAQGRISGMVVGVLPIGLGLVIQVINPEYVRVLFTTDIGLFMVGGAVVSQIFGIFVIRKIVNIEV
ncbi:secretion system protein [Anaerosporomusa subterranea]|uniref:Secretion system protein n=1 Tax=Anaerosporomusa subterranea TaxID=1794912 RepID=A0A154BRM5_ANASB|nr:type II secretion system F family protein [Anaerosporomusa subterranea]KYZ76683.1 secretion system protein [Anaerosporomusa subterranea]